MDSPHYDDSSTVNVGMVSIMRDVIHVADVDIDLPYCLASPEL